MFETKAVTTRKLKKRGKQFKRLHSQRFKRVDASWRRPRGIDNIDRKFMNGGVAIPKIGYRTSKEHRFRDKNNMKRVTIYNAEDIKAIANSSNEYCGEFSKKLSSVKRKSLMEKAQNYGVKIVNDYSRVEKI